MDFSDGPLAHLLLWTYYACFCCGLPTIVIGLQVFTARRITKKLSIPKHLLPDEFKHRCPMCGNKELEWGTFQSQHSFVTEDNRQAFATFRNTRVRMIAARCVRCGHMSFFRRNT